MRLEELTESVYAHYTSTVVELDDPQYKNILIVLKLGDIRLTIFSYPWDSVWFSSYDATVPVARVPSISKNEQVARKILCVERWLPMITFAFLAAVVLKYAQEGSKRYCVRFYSIRESAGPGLLFHWDAINFLKISGCTKDCVHSAARE